MTHSLVIDSSPLPPVPEFSARQVVGADVLLGAAGILALAAIVVWYTMHDQTYIADEVSLGLNAYMTIVGGILGILSAGMYKLIGVGT